MVRLKCVDAHDDLFFALYGPLIFVAGIGDFPLWKILFNSRDHAAHLVNAANVTAGGGFRIERQAFQKIAATKRVGRGRNPRFVGDHLLRAQRDGHRVLGRQGVSFVKRIGMQRLATAKHCGHRL